MTAINTIRENAERLSRNSTDDPRGCGDAILAALAELEKQQPVQLDHIACIDGGELRYMSGRKAPAHDCELYAMPDGKRAPALYAAQVARPISEPVAGWKLVPMEPNREVREALEGKSGVDFLLAYADWRRPTTAAPVAQQPQRCALCNYQHGHQIGCENNPVDIALETRAAQQPQAEQRTDDFGRPIVYDTDAIDEITGALTGYEGEEDSVTVLRNLVRYLNVVHPGKTMTQVLIEAEESTLKQPQAEAVAWRARDANGRWMYGDLPAPELPAGEPELLALAAPQQAEAVPPDVADNWQQYANGSETAQQCIERHRGEQDALLELLKQARAQQPQASEAEDAACWRWLSEHIDVAWSEGGFTRLVRIVSDKHRAMLTASVKLMMAGDWSDAQKRQQPQAEAPGIALNKAAPVTSWNDSRTQKVYEVLTNDNYPPKGSEEHWEGWKARLVVDALFPEQPQADAVPERDTTKPAEQQGLFRKFVVRRTDGSDEPGGKHDACDHFVLDTTHDRCAKAALAAYAAAVEETHPQLAADMRVRYQLAAPQQAEAVPQKPRLIGWRTSDYLMETADKAKADNWAVHHEMLPIFEGDPYTKLAAAPKGQP